MSSATWAPAEGPGITVVVFAIVFLPLPVIAVALRLWARKLTHRKLEFNDYAIIIGAVFTVANSGIALGTVFNGGVGRHLVEVMTDYPLLFEPLMKMTLALAVTWTFATAFIKLSILHLYCVIFAHRRFLWLCYIVMALTVMYCLENVLTNIFICQPISYLWDKTIPGGHCGNNYYPSISSASINMGLDIIVFVLPIPMLWGLNLDFRRRVSLCFVFGVGIVVCVFSALRIWSIYIMDFDDLTYTVVDDGIYGILEPCLGVANACLPLLRPVLAKVFSGGAFAPFTSKTNGSIPLDFVNKSGPSDGFRTNISSGKHFRRIPNDLESSQISQLHPLQVTTVLEIETRSERSTQYYTKQ